MFTIATTTSTRPVVATSAEKVTGPTLLAAVYGGKVRFSKVRETGTLRAWPVLAPGTPARKQADLVDSKRAAKQPVEAIAKEMKVSVPTVRRIITALAFTKELESLKVAEKAALAKGLNSALTAPKEPKKEAKAPAAPKEQGKAKAEPKAPAAPKAKNESNADRLRRMKAEGKVAEKSTTEA